MSLAIIPDFTDVGTDLRPLKAEKVASLSPSDPLDTSETLNLGRGRGKRQDDVIGALAGFNGRKGQAVLGHSRSRS